MTYTIWPCDCRTAMSLMDADSVDSVVCDPPYGLSREPDVAEVMRHWLAGDDYTHGGSGFMGKILGFVRSRAGGMARGVSRAEARRASRRIFRDAHV